MIRRNGTDNRIRELLLPVRILKTDGIVENPEMLLKARDIQIGLLSTGYTKMVTDGNTKASVLLDFGKEIMGGVRLSCKGQTPENVVMHFSFGESVSEALSALGEKGACNAHSVRSFSMPVPMLSSAEYGDTGFRFLLLTLEKGNAVELCSVQAVSVSPRMRQIGCFCSDDPTFGQIYDTAAYTVKLCTQTQLWDGIKRDRLVWVGDMAPEMKALKYAFGDLRKVEEGLAFAAEEAILPKWIDNMPTYSLWWLIVLEEAVFYTGNRIFLASQRQYGVALINQILSELTSSAEFLPGDFLDWPSHETPEERIGIRGITLAALDASAKLSLLWGEETLAKKCAGIAADARKQCFCCTTKKQVAAMLELSGIADGETKAFLGKGGANGMSTFMSYYILTAMRRCGGIEKALQALKQYYGGMLSTGATTFWEDFDLCWLQNAGRIDSLPVSGTDDLHGDRGAYCYKGFRHSLCHGWSAGPIAFLTEQVLGIRILEEGCRKISVRPSCGSLEYVRGCFATPYGAVTVECEKNRIRCSAPKEVVMEIIK